MPIPADAEWDLGDDNLGKNALKALTEAGITPAKAETMTMQEFKRVPGLGVARRARIAAALVRMHVATERPTTHPKTPGTRNPLARIQQLAADNPIPDDLREQIENWIEPETENSETDHAAVMDAIEIAYPLIRDYLAGLAAAESSAS